MQKHRHVQPVHSAREIRPVDHPRKKLRRGQTAGVQTPRAPNAIAQEQSVQDAEAPSLLQMIFGPRN
jgi:hypothetical protein